jgi:uncharacterized protein (DUF1697 family)
MPELADAFAAAGFAAVKTVLSSGNVVFQASGVEQSLQKKAEQAMQVQLGKAFMTFVRPVDELEALLVADPYRRFRLPAQAKRVVTFLSTDPASPPALPLQREDARILALEGRMAFSAYVPGPNGPVFMALIERTFGKEVTTRTWDTLRKVCAAAG